MSVIAAIDRLVESSDHRSSSHLQSMDKDPAKETRPLYRYHSYTPSSISAEPRSPSPSSFSPSPYVVNFKGRGRWSGYQNGNSEAPVSSDRGSSSKFRDPGPSEQRPIAKTSVERFYGRPVVLESNSKTAQGSQEGVFSKDMRNGFYQDDMAGKTLNDKPNVGAEGKLVTEQKRAVSTNSQSSRNNNLTSSGYGEEFFDAFESPSEGGDETSSQVSEYNAAGVSTADSAEHQNEIERCKRAEEALEIVLQKLAAGGLCLPPTLLDIGKRGSQVEQVREQVEDLDISGQLFIKRFVESAVARGAARAEVEEQLEAEIENKNFEIENKSREVTRLRDKVRYNELVNREMSQRNQEAIEMARKKRRTRQKMIRWTGVCVSAAVTIGLVYKYTPWQELKIWKAKPNAEAIGTGNEVVKQ